MQLANLTLNNRADKTFALEKLPTEINLSEVFTEKNRSYLNEYALFVAHFNSIPNRIHEMDIDCKKANLWFIKNYASEVKENHHNSTRYNHDKKAEFVDVLYFLYEDLIVRFDMSYSTVDFLYRKTNLSKIEEIAAGIHKFKKRKQRQKPEILLLANTSIGIDTIPFNITKPKLKIEDNYNEDFKEIHRTILKRLSRKNDKGLVLLHGKPGTGKTSYIRYLIASLKKDIIFLPSNMASTITDPNLISILIENRNSIFVIEDAESIVIDREQAGGSPVSVLLNLSDGLLADCLNIQIICSFNTDISKIDSALMRKGRLIAKYEFKELGIEKAQQLSNKLGFETEISKPMTLTSIYNQGENDFQQSGKSNPIGFQH